MKEETAILLDLIKQNKTLNEISNRLGISNKQLFIKLSMLKNSGYLIGRSYNYNGDINYFLNNPFESFNDSNKIDIEMSSEFDKIKVIITSDYHIGSIYDRLDCIYNMYEYCSKNNIHIILNTGDFFEGIISSRRQISKYLDAKEQISYGLKNYPYDKSILNFVVLGNHDATFWIDQGIDLKTIILERRHDIVPIGYAYGDVNIGGVHFKLQHPIKNKDVRISIPAEFKNEIVLKGHSHRFKMVENAICKNLILNIPSLSSATINFPIPSMLYMELNIVRDYVNSEVIQQFIFVDNKPVRINEIVCYVPIDLINEDSAKNKYNISDTNKYRGMSPLEKFNAKYRK